MYTSVYQAKRCLIQASATLAMWPTDILCALFKLTHTKWNYMSLFQATQSVRVPSMYVLDKKKKLHLHSYENYYWKSIDLQNHTQIQILYSTAYI